MKKKPFLIFLCVFLVVLLCFSLSLRRLSQDYRQVSSQQLEEAVRQTAVACYGAEGAYPPNVAYMVQHYSLRYDEEQFTVHYELFASNVMPEITVVEK